MITDFTRCTQYDLKRCNNGMRTMSLCGYHYHKDRYGKGKYTQPTSEEIERMVSLYASGLSASTVAKMLKRSKPTVLRYARKYNVARPEEVSKGTKYVYGIDYTPKTPLHRRLSTNKTYIAFRRKMFERDKWQCQWCGYKGSKIQLDHILPKSIYPELLFAESNVRTLCIDCHKKTDTYAGRARKNYQVGAI